MACCALAAFVVSQLLLGVAWLRERLGLAAAVAVPSASRARRRRGRAGDRRRARNLPAAGESEMMRALDRHARIRVAS
jgi:hypothetical protein